ncbi:MAG: serine hydrolase [Deltaproteobacteria bacterium]|nr:serine hydrolase [Deltaproteobacteria bacterium]
MSTEDKYSGGNRLVLLIIVVFFTSYFGPSALQLYRVIHLYDEDRIVHNFLNMKEIFPTRAVHAPTEAFAFRRADLPIPASFMFNGEERDLDEYLDYSKSTGMLVLKNDVIVFERYWRGHREDGLHVSWSVAKSFVSALVGIALAEGKFENIHDPITRYLPELEGSGYDGVQIKDILEMSSGVGFNEDYADYDSDINRFSRTIAFGGSMAKFAASLESVRDPGSYHHYVSIDTQVLGMLLTRVTGVSLATYLEEKIWQPIGMEHDAYWMLDSSGMEVALGGLNASLRDYARFGLLYLNRGRFRGVQIVPTQWVRRSTTPGASHLQPGKGNPASSSTWGYGYQWWVPEPARNDYTAAGVYNQYIYVNPAARVVIVKNSANRRYLVERQESKDLHIAMFRAIAEAIGEVGD